MHRISRISLTIDRPNAILAARLYGLRDPAEDPRDLIDHLAAAGEPWLYDILLDFRRFEADLTPDAMAFLIRKWIALEEGHITRKLLGIVTGDLKFKAQLIAISDAVPHRQVVIFDTFDEGLEWINGSRQRAAS
jgi:hypothetical protein